MQNYVMTFSPGLIGKLTKKQFVPSLHLLLHTLWVQSGQLVSNLCQRSSVVTFPVGDGGGQMASGRSLQSSSAATSLWHQLFLSELEWPGGALSLEPLWIFHKASLWMWGQALAARGQMSQLFVFFVPVRTNLQKLNVKFANCNRN